MTRRLDREDRASYQLTVIASNDGFTDMTCTVPVTVNVDDENDNSPEIHYPSTDDHLMVQLSAQAAVGSLVTRIHASDIDHGQIMSSFNDV